VTLQFFLVKF